MFTGESYESKFDRSKRSDVVNYVDNNIGILCRWIDLGHCPGVEPVLKDAMEYSYFADVDSPTYAKLQELQNIARERAVVVVSRMCKH